MISPNVRYQTTDTGISENAKQGKCQILNLSILFYYFQNIENSLLRSFFEMFDSSESNSQNLHRKDILYESKSSSILAQTMNDFYLMSYFIQFLG